jgi:hypothetical protein
MPSITSITYQHIDTTGFENIPADKRIYLKPITAITFKLPSYLGYSEDHYFTLTGLEKESSAVVTDYTKQDHHGK